MSLNAGAKPFVFNPGAGSFVPGQSTSNSQTTKPTTNTDTNTQTTTTAPEPENWEDTVMENNGTDNQPHTETTTSNTNTYSSPDLTQATPPFTTTTDDSLSKAVSAININGTSESNLNSVHAPSPTPKSSASPPPSSSSPPSTSLTDDLPLDSEDLADLREAELEEKLEAQAAQARVVDDREHINIVFIGHVDAGLLTGQVDERTIAKYEKEAKDKNRESWYLAYIMDTNEEERAKGKTVEVGRATFSTPKKRYTLLDAPGHKNYVPNMIGGASQADVGVLVISARKGEFEAGFDRGGQTREHAMLAKTLGLQKLVVLVNKMDEKEVNWRKERYDQIEGALTSYLKQIQFNLKQDVVFIPASGFTGANIKDPVSESICPWYTARKSLFQVLDDFPPLARDATGPLRLPISARYKEMGALFCLGKLESGTLYKDRKLLMMPNKIEVWCIGLSVLGVEVDVVKPGENVLVKVKGIEEEDVQEGFVLSYPDRPAKRTSLIEAMVQVQELLEHKPIIAVGYECMLHVHMLTTECAITSIVSGLDKKTGQPLKQKPKCLRPGDVATIRIRLPQSAAIETFEDHTALGRFTLRDEGKTIAIGKVKKVKEEP